MGLHTPRKTLIADLEAYGEDAVASKIGRLSARDYERLSDLAFTHALSGMLVAKALALAAVEIVEGRPRELRRKRRILSKV